MMAVAGFALSVIASRAAILNETVTAAPAAVGGSLTFNLPQFNSNLGTLNSVTLILTPRFGDFGYSVYNASSTPQTVSYAGVSHPAGTLSSVNALIPLAATFGSTETHQTAAPFSVAPGVSSGILPFSLFGYTTPSVTVDAGSFSSATSALVFDLNSSGTATSFGSPGFPLFYGWFGNVGGSLEINFNYTAVPEPATTTELAGISALGILCIHRLAKMRKRI